MDIAESPWPRGGRPAEVTSLRLSYQPPPRPGASPALAGTSLGSAGVTNTAEGAGLSKRSPRPLRCPRGFQIFPGSRTSGPRAPGEGPHTVPGVGGASAFISPPLNWGSEATGCSQRPPFWAGEAETRGFRRDQPTGVLETETGSRARPRMVKGKKTTSSRYGPGCQRRSHSTAELGKP